MLSNRLINEVITMGAIDVKDRKLVNINIFVRASQINNSLSFLYRLFYENTAT